LPQETPQRPSKEIGIGGEINVIDPRAKNNGSNAAFDRRFWKRNGWDLDYSLLEHAATIGAAFSLTSPNDSASFAGPKKFG
jgi:hypothetical protein